MGLERAMSRFRATAKPPQGTAEAEPSLGGSEQYQAGVVGLPPPPPAPSGGGLTLIDSPTAERADLDYKWLVGDLSEAAYQSALQMLDSPTVRVAAIPPPPPPPLIEPALPEARIIEATATATLEVPAVVGVGKAEAEPAAKARRARRTEKDDYRDVGEKIGGSRKDLATLLTAYRDSKAAVSHEDLQVFEQADPTLAGQLVVRDQQLGDRQSFLHELKDAGLNAKAAYLVSRLYAAIPERPGDTREARESYVTAVAAFKARVFCWTRGEDAILGVKHLRKEVDNEVYSPEVDAELGSLKKEREMAWADICHFLHNGMIKKNTAFTFDNIAQYATNQESLEVLHRYLTCRDAWMKKSREAREAAREDPNPYGPIWQALGADFLRATDKDRLLPVAKRMDAIGEEDWSWAFRDKPAPGGDGEEQSQERERRWTWDREVPEEIERSGVEREIFKAENFRERFGFRGVEYGNWVSGDAAKGHTQAAGEALLDMVDVLNLESSEISLGGRLGLAFGARGKGKAMAHYEPGRKAINLTKFRGGGCLAHEWGHAVDNYLGMAAAGFQSNHLTMATDLIDGTSFQSQRAIKDYRAARDLPVIVRDALVGVMRAIYEGQTVLWKKVEIKPSPKLRYRPVERWDTFLRENGNDAPKALSLILAEIYHDLDSQAKRGIDDHRWVRRINSRIRGIAEYLAEKIQNPVTVRLLREGRTSDFFATAREMGEYWKRPTELFARAFEAFIHDALASVGRKNSYLVAGVGEAVAATWAGMNPLLEELGGKTSIYPMGKERALLNQALRHLIHAMQASGFLKIKEGMSAWVGIFEDAAADLESYEDKSKEVPYREMFHKTFWPGEKGPVLDVWADRMVLNGAAVGSIMIRRSGLNALGYIDRAQQLLEAIPLLEGASATADPDERSKAWTDLLRALVGEDPTDEVDLQLECSSRYHKVTLSLTPKAAIVSTDGTTLTIPHEKGDGSLEGWLDQAGSYLEVMNTWLPTP